MTPGDELRALRTRRANQLAAWRKAEDEIVLRMLATGASYSTIAQAARVTRAAAQQLANRARKSRPET